MDTKVNKKARVPDFTKRRLSFLPSGKDHFLKVIIIKRMSVTLGDVVILQKHFSEAQIYSDLEQWCPSMVLIAASESPASFNKPSR